MDKCVLARVKYNNKYTVAYPGRGAGGGCGRVAYIIHVCARIGKPSIRIYLPSPPPPPPSPVAALSHPAGSRAPEYTKIQYKSAARGEKVAGAALPSARRNRTVIGGGGGGVKRSARSCRRRYTALLVASDDATDSDQSVYGRRGSGGGDGA